MSDRPETEENSMTTEQQDEVEAMYSPSPEKQEEATGYAIPKYDDHDHAEPAAPTATCAFVVVVDLDGNAFATADLSKVTEIEPLRQASLQDFRRACSEIVHDVNAMQTSQQTVALMQQSAQQLAEQARAQQLAQALQQRGLKVPGRG